MIIRSQSGEIINFDRIESIDRAGTEVVAYFTRGHARASLYVCENEEKAKDCLDSLFHYIDKECYENQYLHCIDMRNFDNYTKKVFNEEAFRNRMNEIYKRLDG